VRPIPALMLLILILPGRAHAQSLELFGSAGPTITDSGNSLTLGAGFSPAPRIILVFNFERTHLTGQTSFEDGVFSAFRGGTLLVATGECGSCHSADVALDRTASLAWRRASRTRT
jgi:hypothetical protein